jgi:hypothetical protein
MDRALVSLALRSTTEASDGLSLLGLRSYLSRCKSVPFETNLIAQSRGFANYWDPVAAHEERVIVVDVSRLLV